MSLFGRFRRKVSVAVGVVLLVLAAVAVSPFLSSLAADVSPDQFEPAFRSYGAFGPVLVVSAQVLASIFAPIPNNVITIAAGRIYGGFLGGFYSYVGSLCGAAVTFLIARKLGRGFVRRFVKGHDLVKVDSFISRYGVWAILAGRLVPFLSFDAISYAAGLTSMDLRAFMLASAIGIVPGMFAYSYLGEFSRGLDLQTIVLLSAASLVVFWLAWSWLFARRK